MSRNGKSARRTIGAAVAALAVVAVAGVSTAVISADSLRASTALTPASATVAQTMPKSFADVIEKVSPAVVSVQVTHKGRAGAARPGRTEMPEQFRRFFDDDTMKRFFGENFEERFGNRSEGRRSQPRFRMPQRAAIGSGFIISGDGYIVTNHHVIDGGSKITVALKDGKEYDAKLVGGDPKTDLALLKVKAGKKLPFVKFGESDKARVGDWVVAIGNPFGLGHTVTTGIISARGRNIGAGPYDDFLQIDAPINRGNSGGPAFDKNGDVIGVNTAIFSPTGGNVGIGFAIPAEMAKEVIAELRENGSVERGWLGISIQPLNDDIAASLNLDDTDGAIVAQVNPGSPAAKAKLRQGDVILSVDGNKIERFRDVARFVAKIDPGETAALEIWRDGREMTLKAEIGRQPETDQVASTEESDVLGMQLARLDDRTRQAFGVGKNVEGVVITDVERGSPAWRKGLRRGDVIMRVDRSRVASPTDVAAKIEQAGRGDRKSVLLLITREAQERFVALPLRDA